MFWVYQLVVRLQGDRKLTSRTEDFPLDWDPITVIWGRSWIVSMHRTGTSSRAYNVVGDTYRSEDILELTDQLRRGAKEYKGDLPC
jgi:hypothetical protein